MEDDQLVGWISAKNGEIPEGAIEWGHNTRGPIYLTRAQYGGRWLPALLFTGLKQCRLDCNEGFDLSVRKIEYQILCNVQENWRFMCSGGSIPRGALPMTSDDDNPIYVGRVKVNNIVAAGLVSTIDWQCRTFIGGKTRKFKKFEILTIPLDILESIQINETLQYDNQMLRDQYNNDNLLQWSNNQDENNKRHHSRCYMNSKLKTDGEKYNEGQNIRKRRTRRSRRTKKLDTYNYSNYSQELVNTTTNLIHPSISIDNANSSTQISDNSNSSNTMNVMSNTSNVTRPSKILMKPTFYSPSPSINTPIYSNKSILEDHPKEDILLSTDIVKKNPIPPSRQLKIKQTIQISKDENIQHNSNLTNKNSVHNHVDESLQKSTSESTASYLESVENTNEPASSMTAKNSTIYKVPANDVNNKYWRLGENGSFPYHAVEGGWNHLGSIYVVRCYYQASWIPGKMVPDYEICLYAHDGKIIKSRNYEVLCMTKYRWVKMSANEEIPENAVSNIYKNTEDTDVVNNTSIPEYYIGRAQHDSSMTCGKIDPKTKLCHIIYGEQEHIFKQYEILINTENATFLQKLVNGISGLFKHKPTSNFRRPIERLLIEPDNQMSHKYRLLLLSKKSHDYQYVSKLMHSTIKQHSGNKGGIFFKYRIDKIHQIFNLDLWENYTIECKKMIKKKINVNEIRLFHGSPNCNKIAKEGFDEKYASLTGMFGAGVYFAEHSSKSNQYAFGLSGTGCVKHDNKTCTICERQMLLCRVLMGKVAEFPTAQDLAHAPVGYNSVKGVPTVGGLAYPEYIVYRGEQAYPGYLITYKI